MCYRLEDPKTALRFADLGTALAGIVLVACAVAVAIVVTSDLRPSLEAQQIINASRLMVERAGR